MLKFRGKFVFNSIEILLFVLILQFSENCIDAVY